MTIWQGRLSGELHALADEYNRSLPVDRRLIKEDLEGSIAHVEMLAKQDIIDVYKRQVACDRAHGSDKTDG